MLECVSGLIRPNKCGWRLLVSVDQDQKHNQRFLDASRRRSLPFSNTKIRPGELADWFSMADDEATDPKAYLEERCKPKCVRALRAYQACAKRVKDDETGHKHCTGQYFDYWSCIDKCVAPVLFSKLK